jgi:hypothetical protein
MEENTFWIRVWQMVAAVLATLILTAGGCTAYEARLISKAVEGGLHPIDARCGIGSNVGDAMRQICSVRASR